jgi:hypothetical protein
MMTKAIHASQEVNSMQIWIGEGIDNHLGRFGSLIPNLNGGEFIKQ